MNKKIILAFIFFLIWFAPAVLFCQTLDLKEICSLNYKVDFASLANRNQEDLFPKSSTVGAAHFYRGISYLKQGRFHQAIADFEIAREDSTVSRTFCNFYIGIAYMQLHETDSILKICSEALNTPARMLLQPEFWDRASYSRDHIFAAYLLGTNEVLYSPADTTLIDALFTYTIKDDSLFEGYFNYGCYKFLTGKYKKSIDLFLHARELNPDEDSTLLLCMGYIYRILGDVEQATKSYEIMISKRIDLACAFNNLGCLSAYLEKYNRSIKELSRAIRHDRTLLDAINNRGLVYLKTGKYLQAIDDFTIAIQLSPNSGDAYYYRGFAKKASGDLGGSVYDFSRAIEIKNRQH